MADTDQTSTPAPAWLIARYPELVDALRQVVPGVEAQPAVE